MGNDHFDVAVIGGGPGGYAAAVRLAELGRRVALVERGDLGGECLNRGCIPTKAMLAASGLYRRMLGAASFGVVADNVRLDYGRVLQNRDATVARLRGGVAQMLAARRVAVVRGAAAFTSSKTLEVAACRGAKREIAFGNAVVATGSAAVIPGFLPASPRIVDSSGFLALEALPASLLILGGGALGCEFATMAAQFGSSVTIVEQRDTILPGVDDDVRALLLESFAALGVRVVTGATLADVEADADGVYGTAGGEEVFGDILLVATGRRACVEGLSLATAGVAADAEGVPVDAQCRTSAAHIFAVGDVTRGGPRLANWATMQGLVAAEVICGKDAKCRPSVPSCVFTAPEIAMAGLTEMMARDAGIAVRTETSSFAWNGRALAEGDARGFAKRVYALSDGRLVGVEIVGTHASELIMAAAAEICGGCPPPHPTLCETATGAR
jgi:dihydrolipoamide dehydrogenase